MKVDITTHNFAAVLGTSTLSINARYLDTTFTLTQGTQEISTRDWTDTVGSAPSIGGKPIVPALPRCYAGITF